MEEVGRSGQKWTEVHGSGKKREEMRTLGFILKREYFISPVFHSPGVVMGTTTIGTVAGTEAAGVVTLVTGPVIGSWHGGSNRGPTKKDKKK